MSAESESTSIPPTVASAPAPQRLSISQPQQLPVHSQKLTFAAPPVPSQEEEEEWYDLNSEEADEYEFDSEEEDEDEEEEGSDEEEEEVEEVDEEELKRLLAKEKRQRRRERRPSPENVEGAVPKETLRTLSNKMLRDLIQHAKQEIKHLKTENYLFERTVERLEEPERLVEELYASKIHDDDEDQQMSTAHLLCPSDESEEEPDPDAPVDFSPVIPIEDIDVSTDSFFDNMSDNSREAALNYFRNLGAIAPPHYDVMRDKYEEWMKGSKEDPNYILQAEAELTNATRLSPEVYETGLALIKQKNKKRSVASKKPKVITLFSQWICDGDSKDNDPEMDYGDFDFSQTKLLKVEDKLKLAVQAEEEFRQEFYKEETNILKEESGVQVNVDAHKHSIRLLLNLRKDFKLIMADTQHPMTTKAMSDFILRFKRKTRNQISGEETKARMDVRKTQAVKGRALHQLKCSSNSAATISEIDFEHLTVENEIFMNEMDEMYLSLKYLKQLTSNFFHTLLANLSEIQEIAKKDENLSEQISRQNDAVTTFEKTFEKYKNLIIKTKGRLEDLKRKLKEYHAPKPMDYIHLKASNHQNKLETAALEKKLKDLNLNLITARSNFANLCKLMRNGDKTNEENEAWLREMKEEVAANNFMNLLDEPESDEEDIPSTLRIPKSNATISSAASKDLNKWQQKTPNVSASGVSKHTVKSGGGKSVRKGGLQTLLAAPSKYKPNAPNKGRQPTDYDTDFDFQVSTPVDT